MADYDLRFYKRGSGTRNLHTLVENVIINAASDNSALMMAPQRVPPVWKDSDLVTLSDASRSKLWVLKA